MDQRHLILKELHMRSFTVWSQNEGVSGTKHFYLVRCFKSFFMLQGDESVSGWFGSCSLCCC